MCTNGWITDQKIPPYWWLYRCLWRSGLQTPVPEIDLIRPPSCKAGSSVAAEGSANVRSPLFWEKRGYRQKVSAVDIAAYDGMPNLMNCVSDSIAAFPRRHPILFTVDTTCCRSLLQAYFNLEEAVVWPARSNHRHRRRGLPLGTLPCLVPTWRVCKRRHERELGAPP